MTPETLTIIGAILANMGLVGYSYGKLSAKVEGLLRTQHRVEEAINGHIAWHLERD